TRAKHLQ
ncbi:hypothetical protein BVRB_017170, partial [Beta vulgaris subsp. vulgaris]